MNWRVNNAILASASRDGFAFSNACSSFHLYTAGSSLGLSDRASNSQYNFSRCAGGHIAAVKSFDGIVVTLTLFPINCRTMQRRLNVPPLATQPTVDFTNSLYQPAHQCTNKCPITMVNILITPNKQHIKQPSRAIHGGNLIKGYSKCRLC